MIDRLVAKGARVVRVQDGYDSLRRGHKLLAGPSGIARHSCLEWDEQDDQIVVRRAGRYTSEEVHRALFPEGAAPGRPPDVKEAIRKCTRKKHASR